MAKKAAARKRTTKPTTPAHPDLGKEFYIGVNDDSEVTQMWWQNIKQTKTDVLQALMDNVDDYDQKLYRIFRVRIVEVGVDESNPLDNRKWYSENTKVTKK